MIAGLLAVSCDDDTSQLGGSLTPSTDNISVTDSTYYAVSSSIAYTDSLLARSTVCYLGRYTDPETGSITEADYITQIGCSENFFFPDSVWGLDRFSFPQWVEDTLQGVTPWKANLRLYYQELFGDSANMLTLEIYPLDKIIDPEQYYYNTVDPAEFYDETQPPLISVMVSPTDFTESDSVRQLSNYYRNIDIRLPDSVAGTILSRYYEDSSCFADMEQFLENICKGYYIKCTQGDGTIVHVERTDLLINFKYLEISSSGEADSLLSMVGVFSGNTEVIQFSHFNTTDIDALLAQNNCTYLKTPYGVLTQIELPIDEMTGDGISLNSASLSLTRINSTADQEYQFGIPETVLLVRQDSVRDFFRGTSKVNNRSSFVTTFNSSYNQYSFTNISRLITRCVEERDEWFQENGLDDNGTSREAYKAAHPNWNKILLVPVTAVTDGNSSTVGYNLDMDLNCARLQGGPDGKRIAIKTIRSQF